MTLAWPLHEDDTLSRRDLNIYLFKTFIPIITLFLSKLRL
jgi:hypothetical protein